MEETKLSEDLAHSRIQNVSQVEFHVTDRAARPELKAADTNRDEITR